MHKQLFLILCLACGAALGAGVDDFLRWRLLALEKVPDGGNRLRFALEGAAERRPWDALEVVYRAFPLRRPGSPGDPAAAPEIRRKKAAPNATEIVLYSGRPERIELNARAEKDGRVYYARTLVHSFGESGRGDPESELVDAAPSWPGFEIAPGGYYFSAQAGREVSLRAEPRPARVEVFDDGRLAATLPGAGDAPFRYTPPPGDETRRGGFGASRPLVFAAESPPGARFSLYLPVHRAYYGQLDFKGGLLTLAASMLAALAWVGWRGRKFPWR
ncbi:MAG: hypothetical protein LBS70_03095 [Candidatus Accumulibacter sp.]|nr:hypothetical protein [Accumulibacter sp.]